MASPVERLFAALNRLPIGTRAVRLGHDRLYADSLDRWVAALGWSLGLLEARERSLMRATVRPGMVAVDVGANIGVHTLTLGRCVGPTGRVYALEPEPRNFALLARAVRDAGLAHVRLVQAAAAERSGETALYLARGNRGDHRIMPVPGRSAARGVRAVALDELLADEPRVDFVKIDVQGAEAAVLRGLRRTIARSAGMRLVCELSPALLQDVGAQRNDFFGPLAEAGLRPHLLGRGGAALPVSEEAAWRRAEARGFISVYFAPA